MVIFIYFVAVLLYFVAFLYIVDVSYLWVCLFVFNIFSPILIFIYCWLTISQSFPQSFFSFFFITISLRRVDITVRHSSRGCVCVLAQYQLP